MRISVTPDGDVVVDGQARAVALPRPPGTRAMHWDGEVGYAETASGPSPRELADFQPWLDAWTEAGLPPPPATKIRPMAFMQRFTATERSALRAAAAASDDLADWLDFTRAAQEIDLAAPLTAAGLDALVAAGLITAARREAIAAVPVAPEDRP